MMTMISHVISRNAKQMWTDGQWSIVGGGTETVKYIINAVSTQRLRPDCLGLYNASKLKSQSTTPTCYI